MKRKNNFPPGWGEQRIREVIDYYENQSEKEAVAEAETGLAEEGSDSQESPRSNLVATMTAKQKVQRLLDRLPDDASHEQIQYHLYVLQKIEEGEKDIEEGRVVSHEEVKRRTRKWLDAP